ncbi:hypothetical protein TNCV_2495151 [Trichonephila clavipes]|nr:hypothetical protein TNCV_2495151 [Trichonephila clavipes]
MCFLWFEELKNATQWNFLRKGIRPSAEHPPTLPSRFSERHFVDCFPPTEKKTYPRQVFDTSMFNTPDKAPIKELKHSLDPHKIPSGRRLRGL